MVLMENNLFAITPSIPFMHIFCLNDIENLLLHVVGSNLGKWKIPGIQH